ncbi:MAG: ABC transporter permease [Parvularculaceae bacterium]
MSELFAGSRMLWRKLWRDLWRVKGQGLAIILVIGAGIALLVMSRGMIASLEATVAAYYARYRVADIYAPVKRAPNRLLADIRDLDGVAAAQARIVGGGLLNLAGVAAPISARFVSMRPAAAFRINDIHLVRGRMPRADLTDEALLLEPFARAHDLPLGAEIAVTLRGSRHVFRIVGFALSPEFIYTIPPGDFASDPARFAVLWVGEPALAAAYDLDGAFNEVILTLAHGAHEKATLAALDRLLAPYGATGAYSRADQISNKYLTEELKQLGAMDRVMTPLFLAVSTFLLNIVMTRLVETERSQIGLLKAFGFSNAAVALHYLFFALIIATIGTAVGWVGGLYLGRMITDIYQRYFYFPFLIFVPEYRTLASALLASAAAAGAGGMFAVAAAARLPPALAMRPPAPPKYARGGLIGARLFKGLDQPTRMVLRRLARNPRRAALTCLGVGAAMGLAVMMTFNGAAINYILETNFNVIDRSDIYITFAETLSERALFDLASIDGVLLAEPSRAAPALLRHRGRERLGAITGLPEHPQLARALDTQMRPIEIHGDGVVLSTQLREALDIGVGDLLTIDIREGRRPTLQVPVAGFVDAMIGTPIYMRSATLGRALKEPGRISAAGLMIDPARTAEIYDALKAMPMAAGVSLRRESYVNFKKLLDEGPGTFRRVMMVISIVIAAGVVYNSARIAFIECERDLATMRILGFTKIETGYVLLGELAVLTLLAIPVGSLIGYGLWTYIATALSTDLYSIPTVTEANGFGVAAVIVIVSAAVAGSLVQRDVNRFDLVPVLKSRE